MRCWPRRIFRCRASAGKPIVPDDGIHCRICAKSRGNRPSAGTDCKRAERLIVNKLLRGPLIIAAIVVVARVVAERYGATESVTDVLGVFALTVFIVPV